MADSEQVLTQEQIDAMLSGGSVDKSAPAAAPSETQIGAGSTSMEEIRAREAAPAAVAAPGPSPAGDPTREALQATVAQMSERMAQLEANMQQTGQMQQRFQALADQLQTLHGTVQGMMESLQGTVGFGAHQSFVCRSCQSQGNVAARLNCTACGEENMWGWWPPQQQ